MLTTGSRSGQSNGRLLHSRTVAAEAGISTLEISGRFEDRALYSHIMSGNVAPFRNWASELADLLATTGARWVVVDAWQGYSVAHDLTHLLVHLAVAHAESRCRRKIEISEFAPVPEERWPRRSASALQYEIWLDDAELRAKRDAAWPCVDLRGEIEDLGFFEPGGSAEVERLYRTDRHCATWRATTTPYYERIGVERVKAGIYQTALTENHFGSIAAPLIDEIRHLQSQLTRS